MAANRRSFKKTIDKWFTTLARVCEIESPWIFLCLAALVDYLSSAEYHGHNLPQWDRYSRFINVHFPAKYRRFRYKNGKQDLPTQMYNVLRCGIVHSFSLVPDPKAAKYGRQYSIVLAHGANADHNHLDQYGEPPASDAAYFIAEDFLADTEWAARHLLRSAKRGSAVEAAILAHLTAYPPIAWHPSK